MRADVQRRSDEMVKGMWRLDYTFPGCEERQVYRILFGLWIWFLRPQYLIDQAPLSRAAFRNSVWLALRAKRREFRN